MGEENQTNFEFAAGQYLGVVHPNGTLVPLSIASSPSRLPLVELLYRSDLTSETALAFDDLLQNNTSLQIDGPFGDVGLANINPHNNPQHNPHQELHIIASGTGVAQALSLVEALTNTPDPITTKVLWATQIQTPSSNRILQNRSWLTTTRCNSLELPAKLQENLMLHKGGVDNLKTIIAGPPDFVYQVTDVLLAAGISQDSLAADAFAYAPRG